MELVPGFTQFLQPLALTMAAPTFDSLTTVLAGWVFASRRTVIQMILAAGSSVTLFVLPSGIQRDTLVA